MELIKCKICNSIPATFPVNVQSNGCTVLLHCVECRGYIGAPEWLEHTLEVYGESEELATQRWNMINRTAAESATDVKFV